MKKKEVFVRSLTKQIFIALEELEFDVIENNIFLLAGNEASDSQVTANQKYPFVIRLRGENVPKFVDEQSAKRIFEVADIRVDLRTIEDLCNVNEQLKLCKKIKRFKHKFIEGYVDNAWYAEEVLSL